jgi:flagellar protein FliL
VLLAVGEDKANQPSSKAVVALPAKKSRKGLFVVVATLLFGFGFGVWWLFFHAHSVKPADAAAGESAPTILPLESFTVNLADQEEGRFLRITMALGVDGELPAPAKGQGKEPDAGKVSMAVIRDSILAVLAQSRSSDLLTPEGKAKLKLDISAALNRDVAALQVRDVYFTEFMVQR